MLASWYIEEAKRKLDGAIDLFGAFECSYHTLIQEVMTIMQDARAEKNYAVSDALRSALNGAGIELDPNSTNIYRVDSYKLRKLFADNLAARGAGK